MNSTEMSSLNGSISENDQSMSSQILHRDTLILFLYMITAITAMLGNIFVCVTIFRKKRLNSTTYVLIFNMAVSDILGGFVIPAQWLFCSTALLDTGIFFQSVCGLMKNLQILSYYVSSLTMTAIAYDRYMLVCRPMNGGKRLDVRYLLVLVWILGCIFISQNFATLRVSEYFSPSKVCFFIFYKLTFSNFII